MVRITMIGMGPLESVKIFLDDKNVGKITGSKSLCLNDIKTGVHILQLKSANGKSEEIKLKIESENDLIEYKFNTDMSKAFRTGYYTIFQDNEKPTIESSSQSNSEETYNNIKDNENKKISKKTIIFIVIAVLLVICIAVSNDDSTNNANTSINSTSTSSSSNSVENYFKTAIEHLKSDNVSQNPIQELSISGNKVIYYGDEILVQLSYKTASLSSSSGNYYTATYSVTNNQFYNSIRLQNMMMGDEWKNAKIEEISSDIIDKMNNEYFK
jgi:hypothetical protein